MKNQQNNQLNLAKMGRNSKMSNPYIKYPKVDIEIVKKAFNVVELKTVADMFTYFDRMGQKCIKRDDLAFALRALGYLVTTLEVRELAAFLDPKKTSKISFEQFITSCYYVRNRKPDQNEIYLALKAFDRTKSGYINSNDLRTVLTTIGDVMNQTEFETVIAELEMDSKGYVAIADLIDLLTI